MNPDVRAPFPDAVATNWFVPGYTMTTGVAIELPGSVGDVGELRPQRSAEHLRQLPSDVVRTDLEVTPAFSRLRIPWIFGTEESEPHRDTAAILVNGTNCALVGGEEVRSHHATVVNTGQLATRYDRVTPQQLCDVPVTPGVPVKIQLVVAETYGGALDSAIVIGEGGISSYAG